MQRSWAETIPPPPTPSLLGPLHPTFPVFAVPQEGPASPSVTDSSPRATSPPPHPRQAPPSLTPSPSAFCPFIPVIVSLSHPVSVPSSGSLSSHFLMHHLPIPAATSLPVSPVPSHCVSDHPLVSVLLPLGICPLSASLPVGSVVPLPPSAPFLSTPSLCLCSDCVPTPPCSPALSISAPQPAVQALLLGVGVDSQGLQKSVKVLFEGEGRRGPGGGASWPQIRR